MNFDLAKAIEILERTPQVAASLLNGISDEWVQSNEGEETWSPFDIIGHLIYGEKTDWMIRTEIILSSGPPKIFAPFDRFAQFKESRGKTILELLDEFENMRAKNLTALKSKGLKPDDLRKTGTHPALGEVTLQQLLAAWVAHDLGHIAQICRVMAKQYKNEVGPWHEYIPILDR
jgi:hypothetical protein